MPGTTLQHPVAALPRVPAPPRVLVAGGGVGGPIFRLAPASDRERSPGVTATLDGATPPRATRRRARSADRRAEASERDGDGDIGPAAGAPRRQTTKA